MSYCLSLSLFLGSSLKSDSEIVRLELGSTIEMLNYTFDFLLDGLNIWFVLLSNFLIWICLIVNWLDRKKTIQWDQGFLLSLQVIFILAFTSVNLLTFFLLFELVLIPLCLLVGIYGSAPRNIRASFRMFIYTLTGSLPMVVGIFLLYLDVGSLDFRVLETTEISENRQLVIWLLWFLGFGIKTPIVPFHSWLPETHANASTAGSIVLAGVVLKLGTYGLLKWTVNLLPLASVYFQDLVIIVSLAGMFYISALTLRQLDLKKIIAYSSIAHMAMICVGLFSFNIKGIEGSIFLMLSHGIISSGLFYMIGILYERFGTRCIFYYSGLVSQMPLFSAILLILTLGNTGVPILSASFPAEVLSILGSFMINSQVGFLMGFSTILTTVYSLLLYVKICFGNLKLVYINKYADLNRRELTIASTFAFLSIFLSIFPNLILGTCHIWVIKMLLKIS